MHWTGRKAFVLQQTRVKTSKRPRQKKDYRLCSPTSQCLDLEEQILIFLILITALCLTVYDINCPYRKNVAIVIHSTYIYSNENVNENAASNKWIVAKVSQQNTCTAQLFQVFCSWATTRALVVNLKAIKRTSVCPRVRAHTELYETCISDKQY